VYSGLFSELLASHDRTDVSTCDLEGAGLPLPSINYCIASHTVVLPAYESQPPRVSSDIRLAVER
jgi:hypothetical protein